MKKLFALMLLAVVLAGCQKGTVGGECVIKGVVNESTLEGKRIFLVPMYGLKDAAHVDSIEVKDGKFEFRKDTVMLAKILMDYHFRFNTQTLLVVVEPGEVQVTIDSISSAKGTPQNDVLQRWKEMTEIHNSQLGFIRKNMSDAEKKGDSLRLKSLQTRGDSIHLAYKHQSRKMAADLEDGVLKKFLDETFPLTYKRTMPDGSVVEMDADTNQPLKK